MFLIVIARFEGYFSGYLNALLKCEGFIGEFDILNDIKFLYFSLNLWLEIGQMYMEIGRAHV